MIRLLQLEGAVVDQFGAGDGLYEDPRAQLHRGNLGASMVGSYRLHGGIGQLIDALAASVPHQRLRMSCLAEKIEASENELVTTIRTASGQQEIRSRHLVVAIPPRLAESRIQLDPEATPAFRQALQAAPTWMAGQGKMVALYDRPFWRRQGLSGDAFSHRGPLGEIHDVSPDGEGCGALFGFFVISPIQREELGSRLQQACVDQLARLFGEKASRPEDVFLKDWAADRLTATAADRGPGAGHPECTLVLPRDDFWHDRLVWSGSETATAAQLNNGYLEGALEASERALERLFEGA